MTKSLNLKTESENIISKINENVFFKEFTFDKNDFYPSDGTKELADNILWLDDLLFIIQIKERNKSDIKTKAEENKWFKNKVLKKAKNQIKDSLNFLEKYDNILIQNRREKSIDISKTCSNNAKKLIVYLPNSDLINEEHRLMKFYKSKDVGNIHIFESEDYHWICKFLFTPTEMDDYFEFRERLFLRHEKEINSYPEQYILSHFLNTDDETEIRLDYIKTLPKLKNDITEYDVSGILESFHSKIYLESQNTSTDYYSIIKEIAKLRRYELKEFKTRFTRLFDKNEFKDSLLPYRFTPTRTGCGFVFIYLPPEKSKYWNNALVNFTKGYKYKRNLDKCLGVIVYKNGEYFEVNWAFLNHEWKYNKELESFVQKETEFYNDSEWMKIERYKFSK